MGLDMYLTENRYIGANYEHNNVTGKIDIQLNGEQQAISLDSVTEITLSVAYWRKANAIHQWFVNNVQGGKDECQESGVIGSKLLELKSLCEAVIEDPTKAKELLPTTSGFFFGSTDYDGWYMEDLKETISQLNNIDPSTYYTYQASW